MKRLVSSHRLVLATLAVLAGAGPSTADVSPYSQDFETLVMTNPNALASDGWLVFGNVYDGDLYLYGYGPFPAPNSGGSAFCAIDAGQGGPEQGAQQLSVYSDYENQDHGNGLLIESNVFQEQTIGVADVGNTYVFQFDAKIGNLAGSTTAFGFIKTISGSALTNFITVEMTAIPATWRTYLLSITIDGGLVGQLVQFGFLSNATQFEPSGVFYDNVSFAVTSPVDAPEIAAKRDHALLPASPNPFRGAANIRFSLRSGEAVRIDVFDVLGRRVVRLLDRTMPAGEHGVTWSGLDAAGRPVASGTYWYRMETNGFAETRSVIKIR